MIMADISAESGGDESQLSTSRRPDSTSFTPQQGDEGTSEQVEAAPTTGDTATVADCPFEDDNSAFWVKVIGVFPEQIQPLLHLIIKMFLLYISAQYG